MDIISSLTTAHKKGKILSELNDAQKQAVKNYMGASAIISGPGSGKLR